MTNPDIDLEFEDGEESDEECHKCGSIMYFFQTGYLPPTMEMPGEVLGYFECPDCGERFSI